MAWPKLRKRRSPGPLVTVSNRGEAQSPSPASGSQESGSAESVRLIWPGASAAGAPETVVAEAGQGTQEGEAAEAAADPDDLPFWDWSSDPSAELDDPSDAFAPDRPEYPDGPDDPDYRPAARADPPLVIPASSAAGGSRRARGSAGSAGSAGDKGLRRPREPVVTQGAGPADEPRREGIGQHLGSLAHLSADPRRRAWLWRAIMAVVIVVVVSLLARNWGIGLSLAVLAVIADTIIRSRRVFMGPAAARQAVARRRTRRQLAGLERAGYRAVHGAHIPGGEDQIDHLVVGPAGVFAIDSEAWDRRLPVRTKAAKQLWHGPFSMTDRLEHAHWESERASALLSRALGSQVTVRPAMGIYGPKLPWDVATIRDVDVFRGPRLRRYLRRAARQGDARLLSDTEIDRIDKAAHTAFSHAAG